MLFTFSYILPESRQMDGGNDEKVNREIQSNATGNVKRTVFCRETSWLSPEAPGPYHIIDTQEIKTTWHPIEEIG